MTHNEIAQRKAPPARLHKESGQCPVPPRSRAWKATGTNFEAERDWFLSGCPDADGVLQRRAKLADEGAKLFWDRFLLLVQFVDEEFTEMLGFDVGCEMGVPSEGLLPSVEDYLSLPHLQLVFGYYAQNDRETKNKVSTSAHSCNTFFFGGWRGLGLFGFLFWSKVKQNFLNLFPLKGGGGLFFWFNLKRNLQNLLY